MREQRKQRMEQRLQQQLNQEQKQLKALHSKQMLSLINKYKGLIRHAIAQKWLVPNSADKKLSTQLLIKLAPGGTVLDVKLVKGSGNAALDRSAETAVYKASPLPVPQQPELFNRFRTLRLTVKPERVKSV